MYTRPKLVANQQIAIDIQIYHESMHVNLSLRTWAKLMIIIIDFALINREISTPHVINIYKNAMRTNYNNRHVRIQIFPNK